VIEYLKRRYHSKFFRIIWEKGTGDPECAPRVNRQLSQAVQRNRIKRVLREFFRQRKNFFEEGRWVFIAKANCEPVANREIFNDLEKWFTKVCKPSS
jgi:ribonuclease P protein component